MDCSTVRLLLAFVQRGVEHVEPAEQDALRQHLETCPDCAALAQAEQQADAALGVALRNVPIPAGLQERVLSQLVLRRPPFPYAWLGAAAAVFLLACGLGYWSLQYRPLVTSEDVMERMANANETPESLRKWYETHGVAMECPPQLDLIYLKSYDIVEFKGTRVAKLSYARPGQNFGPPVYAQVLVLSTHQFRFNPDDFGATNIHVLSQGDFIFLISVEGRLSDLLPRDLQVG